MGAALTWQGEDVPEGVSRTVRYPYVIERLSVLVEQRDGLVAGDPSILLHLERRHKTSAAAPWRLDLDRRFDISPAQARRLAELLVLAADRAEASGG